MIDKDIEALETALEAGPTPGFWRDQGMKVAGPKFEPVANTELDTPHMAENAAYIAACSPEVIRRLLAALKDARKAAWGGALLRAPQEARLAKALGALEKIAAIENEAFGGDWDEIERARQIANDALAGVGHE